MNTHVLMAATTATLVMSGSAFADLTITQGPSAPTYTDYTLHFDEDGGPTGVVAPDTWLGSHGLYIEAGDGVGQVDDWDPLYGGWGLGDGNSFFGNFGVFMTFDQDLTGFSAQVWDPSGPPDPFGGGLGVFVFNDGVEVANTIVEPAWGGIGDSWFNIVGDGVAFDEVRILGFGFTPTTFMDNVSWDVVPAPGAFALLAVAGLVGRRRR